MEGADRFGGALGIPNYDNSGADFVQKWVSRYIIRPMTTLTQPLNLTPECVPASVVPVMLPGPKADMHPSSPVFPGCYMPSFCFLVETMNRGTGGRLTVDSVANIGPHYARTLREWKRKFLRNWAGTIAPALVDKYALDAAGLEVFRRKWICECPSCAPTGRILARRVLT